MGSWKKMILGEKMPDKNDPQYKERYEKEVASGRKFARWTRIDKLAAKVQRFACSHPKVFFGNSVRHRDFMFLAEHISHCSSVQSPQNRANNHSRSATGATAQRAS